MVRVRTSNDRSGWVDIGPGSSTGQKGTGGSTLAHNEIRKPGPRAACRRGHAMTPANTYMAPGDKRPKCRACRLVAHAEANQLRALRRAG